MIEPPAVPLAPGWHDDPESPARLRYYDGAAWTDRTSDKTAAATTSSTAVAPTTGVALETAVNDALREGYFVQSRVGDTVVVAKKRGISTGTVIAYVFGIVLLFPIGLLFIIPWVNGSKALARYTLRELPDGTIERSWLYDKPVQEGQPAREQSNALTARFTRWLGASPLRIAVFVVALVVALFAISAIVSVFSKGS